MWYGSASAALVNESMSTASMSIKGNIRLNESIQISLSDAYLKPTLLINSPLIVQGEGSVVKALPKGNIRMNLDVSVNELTQGDIEGAVLEGRVEGSITLKQAIRLMLSILAGKTAITDLGDGNAVVRFRDVNDTKDRVAADMDGSQRTHVTLDTT